MENIEIVRYVAFKKIDEYFIEIIKQYKLNNLEYASAIENEFSGFIYALKICEVLTTKEWRFLGKCIMILFYNKFGINENEF